MKGKGIKESSTLEQLVFLLEIEHGLLEPGDVGDKALQNGYLGDLGVGAGWHHVTELVNVIINGLLTTLLAHVVRMQAAGFPGKVEEEDQGEWFEDFEDRRRSRRIDFRKLKKKN